MEYVWLKGTLQQAGASATYEVFAAIITTLLEGLPEIIFAYYFNYRVINRWLKKNISKWWIILEAALVLVVCIYAVRIAVAYFIIPYLYLNQLPIAPHLEFRRFVTLLFNFIATTGLLMALKTHLQQSYLKKKQDLLVKEKLEAEIKFLKNQVNPHFLFNTLNSIYGLTRKKSDAAPEAVLKLSELLSYMLYESNKRLVPIASEIKIIEDYIELQKIRFGKKVTVQFYKNIDDEQNLVSPLLLIPLVENAFKFGVGESTASSYIHIKLLLHKKTLIFEIENSIEEQEETFKPESIGLNSLRRQLELMYAKHELTVHTDQKKFKVYLLIMLNTYGENELPDY